MLSELTIRNFAIIDDLSLSLARGMTVLSGETGAGKSILIDALGLLLGDRADSDAVRDGEARAEITAAFVLHDAQQAQQWLREYALDDGDNAILRRVISREGRSRNWINGAPVNARDLAALGEFLVDIHGQHEHQSLLKSPVQRNILDAHGAHTKHLQAVAAKHIALNALEQRIADLEQLDASGQSRLELLRYQVNELQALNLQADALEKLEAEHRRLGNAERLISEGQSALNLLYDNEDNAAINLLGAAERLLIDLSEIEPDFVQAVEMATGARIQTAEAADSLRRQLEQLELDPQRLAEIDSRLAEIQDIARKHHCRPRELPEYTQRLNTELDELENAQELLQKLYAQQQQALTNYHAAAKALHQARVKAGAGLATEVSATISGLGMPQGEFAVAVEFEEHRPPSVHGLDRISFLVSANPGQKARPLEKVASGGELSRISLAIQVAAAASTRVPTLVFDEVDAGIGGGVAEIVGRLLRRLGADRQALCVTHLPQVAAQAQQHLVVAKTVSKNHTRTQITALDAAARVQELARMLGGMDITEQTRAHASEMLAQANG